MHLRFLSLQLFLELGLLAPPTGAAPMLTGLGDLQGGIFGSWANAISADGFTVVGSGTSTAGVEAFLVTVPEPPTGALRVGTLLTMGLLSLMSLQRSKAP